MKGIYIHIPFCQRKCAYCNFVSFESGDISGYIQALKREISLTAVTIGEAVDTVFFGGGTPSIIPADYISEIIDTMKTYYDVSQKAEISIEVNPGTIDNEKLKIYRSAGINRMSLGLQSADDGELKMLGRIHTFNAFAAGCMAARDAGFDNINIDLIFGLPGQTTDGFKKTLDTVLAFNPEHISCYALKLEKGTPMYSRYFGSDELLDEDTERSMYHLAIERLEAAGYEHYETSNFAKHGFACQHNLKYWLGEEYLGFGVAAHGYYQCEAGYKRVSNTDNLGVYIQSLTDNRLPIKEEAVLSGEEIQEEYIMLRMRLKSGISFNDYRHRFGKDFTTEKKEAIERLKEAGLITSDINGIYPTVRGFDLQNIVIGELL